MGNFRHCGAQRYESSSKPQIIVFVKKASWFVLVVDPKGRISIHIFAHYPSTLRGKRPVVEPGRGVQNMHDTGQV